MFRVIREAIIAANKSQELYPNWDWHVVMNHNGAFFVVMDTFFRRHDANLSLYNAKTKMMKKNRPLFKHDCKYCTYLGIHMTEKVAYDLYACDSMISGISYVAREGHLPEENISMSASTMASISSQMPEDYPPILAKERYTLLKEAINSKKDPSLNALFHKTKA